MLRRKERESGHDSLVCDRDVELGLALNRALVEANASCFNNAGLDAMQVSEIRLR